MGETDRLAGRDELMAGEHASAGRDGATAPEPTERDVLTGNAVVDLRTGRPTKLEALARVREGDGP
ncbi:MAG: hypothetical protein ACLGH4_04430 [Actinomycetes bacterium]